VPDRFQRLRGVVWTAVIAVAAGISSVAAAICGVRTSTTTSLAALGVVFAVLSPRQ